MAKLTKAQERFLRQANDGWRFARDSLSGPEVAMAERLRERGLIEYLALWDGRYLITDAGRQLLQPKADK